MHLSGGRPILFSCVLGACVLAACKPAPLNASPDAAPSATASASAAPVTSGSSGGKASQVGTVVPKGALGVTSMVVSDAHVYIAGPKDVSRVPRDAGDLEVLAKDQDRPEGLVLHQGDLVWMNAPEKGPGQVRSIRTINQKAYPIHELRSGEEFTGFTANETEIFLASIAGTKSILTRVKGPTAVRLGDVPGRVTALAADKTELWVATDKGLSRVALATGVATPHPIPNGIVRLFDHGSLLFAIGTIDGKTGVFRIPKESSVPALAAEGRIERANAALADALYVVDTAKSALLKVGDTGDPKLVLESPALSTARALAVAGETAWIATVSGAIVKSPIPSK